MKIQKFSGRLFSVLLSVVLFIGLLPDVTMSAYATSEPGFVAEQGEDQTDVTNDGEGGNQAGEPGLDPEPESGEPEEILQLPEPAVSLFGLQDHLIINQAAGVGKNADGALSHSFVEIYNPTDAAVSLDGKSLQYADNGAAWNVLKLSGSIPPSKSFLVRANGTVNSKNARYEIYYADMDWSQVISNDSFKFALVEGIEPLNVYNPAAAQGVIDLIGAYNTSASVDFGEGGAPLRDISKQKSARRTSFFDTDNNTADFESVDYRTPHDQAHPSYNRNGITDARLKEVRPCSLRDGDWSYDNRPELPEPPASGEIIFSETAGLFTNDFPLTLTSTSEGAFICYTLDGEDPDPSLPGALIYNDDDPIEIKDRTGEAKISLITDGITGPKLFNGTYYPPAKGNVFKGTVVKAQLFGEDNKPLSTVYVNSYFVDENICEKYGAAPIISISTPKEYLFNQEYGIYQMGPFPWDNDYSYPEARPHKQGSPVYNFDQSWERPVYFEMFDPALGGDWATDPAVDQGMGIRIHGSNSRHNAQKSLRLYARTGDIECVDAYGVNRGLLPVWNGKSTVTHDIFNGGAKDYNGNHINGGFKRFILRSGGNDVNQAFIRNPLTNVIGADTNTDTGAYRPAVVFINGEFWGLYDIYERYDDEYLVQHYGGNKDYYDFLDNPSTAGMNLEQGTLESQNYYRGVVADIENAVSGVSGMNTKAAYDKVLSYVDEDSLIDNVILETFFGNGDWVNKISEGKGRYGNNSKIWRYTRPNSNPGQDGKYRWMLHDMDHSLDLSRSGGVLSGLSYAPYADTITYAIYGDNNIAPVLIPEGAAKVNNYFFYMLMHNDTFKAKFVNRYMDLLNTDLKIDVMEGILDDFKAGMKDSWPYHKLRWNYSMDYNSWINEVEFIRSSLRARANESTGIVGNSLYKYVKTGSTLADLTLESGGGNGYIRINGMDLSGDGSWKGRYYSGYTQTIEAIPDSGYKFSHFEINDSGTRGVTTEYSNPLSLEMKAGGFTVTAVYEDASAIENPGLIINQVFAGGPNDNSASITHSFIELYNPTDKTVSLAGFSLQVQNGNGNGTEFPVATEWLKYDFGNTDSMAPKTSLLIRLDEVAQASARYKVDNYDISWTVADGGRLLSNRSYSVALVSNQTLLSKNITSAEMAGVVDLLGAKNTNNNDVSLNYKVAPYNDMSKQKTVRRIDFKNDGNNLTDFTSHDYRTSGISNDVLTKVRPRWSGDGAWPIEEPVKEPLIINQVFAGGPNDNSASITHSFIELYNPTDKTVSLKGWSLQVQNGNGNGTEFPVATEWLKYDFGDTVSMPSKTSLLIRLDEVAQSVARYKVVNYDISWTVANGGRLLSNRAYSVALVCNQTLLSKNISSAEMTGVVDLLGAKNTNNNDVSLNYKVAPYNDMSKQKTVRRVDFKNEGNNLTDFTSHDYRASGISNDDLAKLRPRSLIDGAWPKEEPPVGPGLPDHLVINQAAGVGVNADGAIQYSFAELYNPTEQTIVLDGWSLQYATNSNGGNVEEWHVLPLEGEVPSKHSYLIRMNGGYDLPNTKVFMLTSDLDWILPNGKRMVIDNEALMFALVNHTNALSITDPLADAGVVDFLGAMNTNPWAPKFYEGASYAQKFSKQQSTRRNNFADTDNNRADFTAFDYRNVTNMEDPRLLAVRPRSLEDGAWEDGDTTLPLWIDEWRNTRPLPQDGKILFKDTDGGNRPAGLYTEEFLLDMKMEMTTAYEGAYIVYTTNGDDPDPELEGALVYDAKDPIRIYDRTDDPETFVHWPKTHVEWLFHYTPPPVGSVTQGTVLKAQIFAADGRPISGVYVNSYFVRDKIKERYGELPIISISTPGEYFFSEEKGIYVQGTNAPPWGTSLEQMQGSGYSYNWGNNYDDLVGSDFERPVHIEMFEYTSDPESSWDRVVSQGMGVRPHGGNIRVMPQKALRFYAREGNLANGYPVLNGKTVVDYDLFQGKAKNYAGETLTGYTRFLLRCGGNDTTNSFIRDPAGSVIAKGFGDFETQSYRPVAVFLNGEFWGVYHLLERFDDEYLAAKFGGNKNNYDILENPSNISMGPAQGTPESIAYYRSMAAKADSLGNMNTEYAYKEMEKIVDIDSLVDYAIMEVWAANCDWASHPNPNKGGKYGNNQKMWRYTGTPTDKPGQDGRYRWMLYDLDFSMGFYWERGEAGHDSLRDILVGDPSKDQHGPDNFYFFYKLWGNDKFREKFINRFMDLLNTHLSYEEASSIVNSIAAELDTAMPRQKARWPFMPNYNDWRSNVNGINSWIAQRSNPSGGIVANGLNKYSGASLSSLTLKNMGSGYIRLNGIDLEKGKFGVSDEGTWSGSYYATYTQEIEAVPQDGKEFLYFVIVNGNNQLTTTDRKTEVEIAPGGTTVIAVYSDSDGAGDTIVVGGTEIEVAAFIDDDDADKLPQKVGLLNVGGLTEADVTWDFAKARSTQEFKVYNRVTVTGYIEEADIEMTAEIELIPRGLVYYIDCGTIANYPKPISYFEGPGTGDGFPGNGSDNGTRGPRFYDLVKTKLEKEKMPALLNEASDKFYDNTQPDSQQWGLVEDSYGLIAYQSDKPDEKIASGYGGNNSEFSQWYQYQDPNDKQYIEYKVYLPEGNYVITTGHYNWWDFSRNMQIKVDGVIYGSPLSLGYMGSNGEIAFAYTQENSGVATITINLFEPENTSGDGPLLSYIFINSTDDNKFYLEGDSEYRYAVYKNEPSPLPETVKVRSLLTGNAVDMPVTWDNEALNNAKEFDFLTLTGTVENTEITLTARIDVIPRGVIYFIDSGTMKNQQVQLLDETGDFLGLADAVYTNSETYEAIKEKVAGDGRTLANGESDRIYSTNMPEYMRWGLVVDTIQWPARLADQNADQKLVSGIVGHNSELSTWYDPEKNANDKQYIEYKVFLYPGTYTITTGHYNWWDYARRMDVQVNGVSYCEPFQLNTAGQSKIVTFEYVQEEAGEASITVFLQPTAEAPDGALLSYIFIYSEDEDIYTIQGGTHYEMAVYTDETAPLPGSVEVIYTADSAKNHFANVTWDYEPLLNAEVFTRVNLTGTVEGYPEVEMTATLEVIPRGLVYYIDAATSNNEHKVSYVDQYGNWNYSNEYRVPPDSNAYGLVRDRLNSDGTPLINQVSDKYFENTGYVDRRWGFREDTLSFAVHQTDRPDNQKLVSGYVGYDAPESQWYNEEEIGGKKQYLEYDLYLKEGEYIITTGHYTWWDFGRNQEVRFNDVAVTDEFEFKKFGDTKINTIEYTHKDDGLLNIKVHNKPIVYDEEDNTKNSADGPTLSYIFVQKVESAVVTHTVTFNSDNGVAPVLVPVQEGNTVTRPASDPVKAGHTFLGWFAGESTTAFDFTTPITANITLKARYKPITLIINQAYGSDNATDGAVSNSFIEIYNPTDAAVDLSTWSVQYYYNSAPWAMKALAGIIPPHHSYLIMCTDYSSTIARYNIPEADLVWEGRRIQNNAFSVALVENQNLLPTDLSTAVGIVDLVGASNTGYTAAYYEGAPLTGLVSKQKTVRRIDFRDTDNNFIDFVSSDYRYPTGYPGVPSNITNSAGISDYRLAEVRPRSLADGPFEAGDIAYTVTFNYDNGADLNRVKVDFNNTVSEPSEEPVKSGYDFLGWFVGDTEYVFSAPITRNIVITAKWEFAEEEDDFSLVGDDEFRFAMYKDDASPLPDTVEVMSLTTGQITDAPVTWDDSALAAADDFDFLTLTGTVANTEITLTAVIDIIPRGLVYFIDSGTVANYRVNILDEDGEFEEPEVNGENCSQTYNAVKERITDEGRTLFNEVSDKIYDASAPVTARWGILEDTIQFAARHINQSLDQKLVNGYVGYNSEYSQWYGYQDPGAKQYIEYKIYLPAGTYNITTGHYNWWDFPRCMEIRVNGVSYSDEFLLSDIGDTEIVSFEYDQEEAGEATITVFLKPSEEAPDGAELSFIAIAMTDDNVYTIEGGTHYEMAVYTDESSPLPETVEIVYIMNSAKNHTAAVEWDYAPLQSAKEFDRVNLTGTIDGYAGVQMTATLEVIPRGLVYYIDSATSNNTYTVRYTDRFGNGSEVKDGIPPDSNSYGLVRDRLASDGTPLRNEVSDKYFEATGAVEEQWGVMEDSFSFSMHQTDVPEIQKLASGYVGFDAPGSQWYDEEIIGGKKQYIEYNLYLPAGNYIITTGHYTWWNFGRNQEVQFNDIPVTEPFSFDSFGDYKVNKIPYTQETSGILNIKVHNVPIIYDEVDLTQNYADGPTLSYIFVQQGEAAVDKHLIINQAYGSDNATDGAVTNSFIELYNPTDEAVDLSTWSVQYAYTGEWFKLDLEGTIPAHHSFLIMTTDFPSHNARYKIPEADMYWEGRRIQNNNFSIALVKNQNLLPTTLKANVNEELNDYGIVDLVGASNTGYTAAYYEGTPLTGEISKQKSARRVDFADTDNNVVDFKSIDYRVVSGNNGITDEAVALARPRSLADGEWKAGDIAYTVTFNKDNGEDLNRVKVDFNTKVSEPSEEPIKDGHDFLGWFVGDAEYDFSAPITRNIVITAKWEISAPDTFTVTFKNEDGSVIDEEEVAEGEKVTRLPGPEKLGYLFLDWYAGEMPFDFDTPITENLVLTARYTQVMDYAALIINQAAAVNAAADGAISHAFVEIYNPTRETVSLRGWSLQHADNGTNWQKLDFPNDAEIPPNCSYLVRMEKTVANHANNYLMIDPFDLEWKGFVHNNDTFKYALVRHQKTLNMHDPGEENGVVDFVSANNPPNNPPAGWGVDFWWGSGPVAKFSKQQSVRRVDFVDTKDNAKDFVSIDYRTANGMTDEKRAEVRPRSLADGPWGIKYIVTFNSDGGTEISPVAVPDGGKVARPADPVKEGFTFDDWYLGSELFDFETPVTENLTLTAKWNATLEGIAITTLPTKTIYKVGEKLDLAGIVVTATNADGGSKVITGLVTTDPANGAVLDTAGVQWIYVYYTEGASTKFESFSITVLSEAAAGTITVSSVTGLNGQTVEVPIVVERNPGIVLMRIKVDYDSDIMTLTNVIDCGILGTSYNSPTYGNVPYTLVWNNSEATQNIIATGTVAKLKFKIADNVPDGSYSITLSYEYKKNDILDVDGQPVYFGIENGTVNVISFLYGDVNRDGEVDMLDAMVFARWMAKWANYKEIDERAADLDGDGEITAWDLVVLQRHLAEWDGYETLPVYFD